MPADSNAAAIPVYALYAESAELPDVLHCEAIADRAPLHDWNIRPHRHERLHQFFLIRAGGGTGELDGRPIALDPPRLVSVPARTVHRFAFVPGTQGWVVTVPLETLATALGGGSVGAALLRPGAARAGDRHAWLFEAIAEEHGGTGSGRTHLLVSLAAVLAGVVARALQPRSAAAPQPRGGLASRFEALVEAHYRDHWRARDFAARLGISRAHMTRLARAELGAPASRIVEARLLREARRMLAYTNLPVAQIAYALGFEDPAYFTRVFRRGAGLAPSAYRSRFEAAGG